MAENEISDYLEVDADNLDITGISVQENVMRPPAVNNAFRALQGALKRWFRTNLFRLRDGTDQTKLLALDVSAFPTATTRTVSFTSAGALSIANGGTGAVSAADARDTLGFVARDSITVAGLAGNDPTLPYFRQLSTNDILYLQRAMTTGTGWYKFGPLLIQHRSEVINTNASGIGTLTLPTPFAGSSSYNVVAWNGDVGTSTVITVNHYRSGPFPGNGNFLIRATQTDTGANYSGVIRVDYIAIGI